MERKMNHVERVPKDKSGKEFLIPELESQSTPVISELEFENDTPKGDMMVSEKLSKLYQEIEGNFPDKPEKEYEVDSSGTGEVKKTIGINNKNGWLKGILHTALVGATVFFGSASGIKAGQENPKEQSQKIEKTISNKEKENKILQEKAIELIENLYTIPPTENIDEKDVKAKALDHLRIMRVAELKIKFFALRQKLGFPEEEKISGHVFPDDMKKTIILLKSNLNNFADRKFRDKEGKMTQEEIKGKLREVMQSNPGLYELGRAIKMMHENEKLKNKK